MGIDNYEEHEALISALPDLVFVLTESGRYAAVFGGGSQELYHQDHCLVGRSIFEVLPLEKAQWFHDRIHQTLDANKLMVFDYSLAGNDVNTLTELSGPEGTLRFEGRVNPLPGLRYGERAVIWVARNITERYELQKRLTYQSEVDALSHTFNRRKLFAQLEHAFYAFQRYQENYSFLLLDIDDFKLINDTYGHQCGDKAIQNLADCCRSQLRRSDTLGRLGGDEFAIIHKMTSNHSVEHLAKRMKDSISQLTIDPECCDIKLSISIGISQFNTHDYTIDQIYKRADVALYVSKQKGKNCISTN
ncbi:diguanylate cyclase [Vibrio astriarenae]